MAATLKMREVDHKQVAINIERPMTMDEFDDEQIDEGNHKLADKINKGSKVFTNNVVGSASPKDSLVALRDNDQNTKDLLDDEELDQRINPILYVRGVESDNFYLILKGKVSITSGNEQFILE